MYTSDGEIDFVITTVDDTVPGWRKGRDNTLPNESSDTSANRYRDWGTLKYVLRGIDAYAPWVRKVFLVVSDDDSIPKFIDNDHYKLHIVKHSDFIPKQYLPTYNNRCIELNLHRISGLSEQFVYFNDDMFLLRPVKCNHFFRNGKPVDAGVLNVNTPQLPPNQREGAQIYLAPVYNAAVISRNFSIRRSIAKRPFLWINLRYGKQLYRTLTLMIYRNVPGFYLHHLPYPYLKNTFKKVWKKEGEICDKACSHLYRNAFDVNQQLMGAWQLAENNFYPRRLSVGKCYSLGGIDQTKDAIKDIEKRHPHMVCLNDDIRNADDAPLIIEMVRSLLEKYLPDPCGFEKKVDK